MFSLLCAHSFYISSFIYFSTDVLKLNSGYKWSTVGRDRCSHLTCVRTCWIISLKCTSFLNEQYYDEISVQWAWADYQLILSIQYFSISKEKILILCASGRGLYVTASSSRVQTLNPKQCYCFCALTTTSANVTLAVLGQTKGHVGQYSESSSGIQGQEKTGRMRTWWWYSTAPIP